MLDISNVHISQEGESTQQQFVLQQEESTVVTMGLTGFICLLVKTVATLNLDGVVPFC